MQKTLYLLTLCSIISGCAAANVSSSMRRSSTENHSMETRCVTLSTGSHRSMNKDLERFDGWKLAYVSEYTTSNKFSTAMVMCFEKPH